MESNTAKVACPHERECGACAHLGVAYAAQLRIKRDLLARALGKHARLRSVRPTDCLPSPVVQGYRNRAKMAIGISRDREIHVGYFRSGSREIVDAPDCRVLLPELLETTRRIRRFLDTTSRIPKTLRHIDLRCGSDPMRQHLTLVFRTTEMPRFPLDALRRKCSAIDGISINLNPTAGPQVIRGSIQPVWGEREVWVESAGLRLRVSPGAFFQVNLAMLPPIHDAMRTFLGQGKCLADLYAGVGTHGLALRKNFERILFAEGNRSAVADLKSTLTRESIHGTRVSAVAVERGLAKIREARPDAAILNPSRSGAEGVVLEEIARSPVRRLAYLSCDPATLCRDLEILQTAGFAVRSVQPIDMMPQTRQVEALALLEREASKTRPTGAARPGRTAKPRALGKTRRPAETKTPGKPAKKRKAVHDGSSTGRRRTQP